MEEGARMNLEYTLQGITFEWDSRKAAASLKEHRIQFETACEAFFDPFVLAVEEPVHLEERRDAIIGMTIGWRLVYVLKGDVIRIISARTVTSRERIQYEDR